MYIFHVVKMLLHFLFVPFYIFVVFPNTESSRKKEGKQKKKSECFCMSSECWRRRKKRRAGNGNRVESFHDIFNLISWSDIPFFLFYLLLYSKSWSFPSVYCLEKYRMKLNFSRLVDNGQWLASISPHTHTSLNHTAIAGGGNYYRKHFSEPVW